MRIIHDLGEMTETARGWLAGGTVGFVPTMGYLHEGHLSLVRALPGAMPKTLLAIAVHIGTIRLTDNIIWLGDGDWLL